MDNVQVFLSFRLVRLAARNIHSTVDTIAKGGFAIDKCNFEFINS